MTVYANPVIRGMNPDPTVCRRGEDYYLATSTMHMYPGVPIYHSRDLVHWRLIGHCLTRPEHFQSDRTDGRPMIYAPTLRYHDGRFVMVTTNVHGGGNFLVTALDPAGPWSDPVVIDDDVFDPSLLFDDDGRVYYTRRGPMDAKTIVQAEIEIDTGRLISPLRVIGTGMISDDAEGPHLYHIGAYYYLLQAEGGSRFLHMATIGRSRSPWGPFDPCPHNPILAQHHAWWHAVRSAGHADLIEAHDGSWWAVFLATRHASYDALSILGRETFLAPVAWREGWPLIDAQAVRGLSVDAQCLPTQPWPLGPERDGFRDGIGPEWVALSAAGAQRAARRSDDGGLRLCASAHSPAEGADCAFLGIRQRDLRFVAATALDLQPRSESDEAGITVFQRANFRYDLAITRRGNRRAAVLRRSVGDIVHEDAATPVPAGLLELRVEGFADRYEFEVVAGGTRIAVGSALTQLIAAEVASCWSGVLIGLAAVGDGAVADFEWFEYSTAGCDGWPE